MDGQTLTIVMYHYVRPLAASSHPRIKGLDYKLFIEQLGYIQAQYNVISAGQLLAAIENSQPLPPRALLLSFDDGYADHYNYVLPALQRRGLTGCFFAPARCISQHEVLGVNKIHFILASVDDASVLVSDIFAAIKNYSDSYDLKTPQQYWQQLAVASRFDPPEVIFCKRILQRELPLELREKITDELFCRYVSSDVAAFSQQLYMNTEQLRTLVDCGMYVGSHGYDHFWLNTLDSRRQQAEVDKSLEFLTSIGAPADKWIMCYPYGAYNDSLLEVLKSRNCVAGLTTEVALASLNAHNPLTLPRLDTNDLPKDASATPNSWTQRARFNLPDPAIIQTAAFDDPAVQTTAGQYISDAEKITRKQPLAAGDASVPERKLPEPRRQNQP